MMKTQVQSNVHLLTANAPSAKVLCHRVTSGCHSSFTNAFLKEGGALPSVLPIDDGFAELSCKPTKTPRNQPSSMRRKSKKEVSKQQLSATQLANHQHTCQLEKKMEHISSKLTIVQDILKSHLIDTPELIPDSHVEQDENGSFSARDYTYLVLEMNGNIPSLPYDPHEFSESP